jgi:hypothetical protein
VIRARRLSVTSSTYTHHHAINCKRHSTAEPEVQSTILSPKIPSPLFNGRYDAVTRHAYHSMTPFFQNLHLPRMVCTTNIRHLNLTHDLSAPRQRPHPDENFTGMVFIPLLAFACVCLVFVLYRRAEAIKHIFATQ